MALARADRRPPRAAGRSRRRCSTCRSSASMNTSASCSIILETIALYQAMRAEPTRDWVPRVKIFAGKAAASYTRGQADHQADQRRRRGRSTAIRASRDLLQGRLPARLQCQPGRDDHSGGRSVGADLDRRHGSVGHRQHEAGAQWRADDRHARRRQYRDPRACRRRQHLHLRHGGEGRHGSPQAGTGRVRRDPHRRRLRVPSTRSAPASSRQASPAASNPSRMRCAISTTTW